MSKNITIDKASDEAFKMELHEEISEMERKARELRRQANYKVLQADTLRAVAEYWNSSDKPFKVGDRYETYVGRNSLCTSTVEGYAYGVDDEGLFIDVCMKSCFIFSSDGHTTDKTFQDDYTLRRDSDGRDYITVEKCDGSIGKIFPEDRLFTVE